jgi:hypothetical protein
MAGGNRRKCKCCLQLFRPEPRNRRHQRCCSATTCRGFWCKLCFNANLQIRSPLNSLAYIVPHCAKNGRLHQSHARLLPSSRQTPGDAETGGPNQKLCRVI